MNFKLSDKENINTSFAGIVLDLISWVSKIKVKLAKKGKTELSIMKALGQGAQGTVYQVKNGTEKLALKIYNRDDKASVAAQRRARKIGNLIQDPQTGALSRAWNLDNGEDENQNPIMLYKLFPYKPIEDYHDGFVRPLNLRIRERMAVGVTAGLVEIHKHRIVHADLAPINVLYSPKGEVAIIDFDGAGYYPKNVNKNHLDPIVYGHVQFPSWVAPEEVLNKNATFGTDVWWVGSIIMKILTNFSPYFFLKIADHESLAELNDLITTNDVSEWPPNYKTLMRHSKAQPALTSSILKKVRNVLNQTIATATLSQIFSNYTSPDSRPRSTKLWTSFRSRVFR